MTMGVMFNREILREFKEIAFLTEDEEKILKASLAGWSRVQQSLKLGMSLSAIDRKIKSINTKYDDAQRYSKTMPPRKKVTKN